MLEASATVVNKTHHSCFSWGLQCSLGFISLFSIFMGLKKYLKVQRKWFKFKLKRHLADVAFWIIKKMLQHSYVSSLGSGSYWTVVHAQWISKSVSFILHSLIHFILHSFIDLFYSCYWEAPLYLAVFYSPWAKHWGTESACLMGLKLRSRRQVTRMLSRFSCVRLSVTPWTVARQTTLSWGFSRQEYWGGLPFPFPGGNKPAWWARSVWCE